MEWESSEKIRIKGGSGREGVEGKERGS